MTSATEIFELLCWDDDELLVHMGVLEEMTGVFTLKAENDEERSALIKFNGKFSLGFLLDKEANETYFVVNGREFSLQNEEYMGRYKHEMQKICRFFGKTESAKIFVNKLLLPWVCTLFDMHFENIDLSAFML